MRRSSLWRALFGHREWGTVLVLIIVLIVSSQLSPYFIDSTNLSTMPTNFMEDGIIALAMTMVIAAGEVDISVASMVVLTAGVFGKLNDAGLPIWLCTIVALLFGSALGAINGLLVTRFKISSLVVTLGTRSLYSGLASALLGSNSISDFPGNFVGINLQYLGNTLIPVSLLIFLGLALAFGVLLHFTVLGRQAYMIGTNRDAARFSGVHVDRVTVVIFTLSGFASAIGAIMFISRFGSVRSDLASGDELAIITAVLLGGASIFGGSGSIVGTVLAVFAIGSLQWGMGLDNLSGQSQQAAIGAMLVLSILLPHLLGRLYLKFSPKPSDIVTMQASAAAHAVQEGREEPESASQTQEA